MSFSNDLNSNFKEEIKKAFDSLDQDNSGTITVKELEILMKELKMNPTQNEIAEMIQEEDSNVDGMLNFEEFQRIIFRMIGDKESEEGVLDAFKIFDKDRSGKLEYKELKSILMNTGDNLSEEDVENLLDSVKFDENNQIDYYEFVRKMFNFGYSQ